MMPAPWLAALTISIGCLIVVDAGRRYYSGQSRDSRALPPGPPGVPWIGNVIGIDPNAPWLTYTKWSKKYGDLVYSRLLGRDIIIINSEAVAKDLLDNRSRNYSDRPFLSTVEMSGLGFATAFLPYGDRWRLHRQLFHQTFRAEAIPRFLSLQDRKVHQLILMLLKAPDRLDEHVFEYTTSVILNSIYDYDPLSRKDSLVLVAARVLEIVLPAIRPDIGVIIGAFPALLKLPSWFPGMLFKQKLAVARECSKEYIWQPFEYSMKKLRDGSSSPSLMYDALRKREEQGFECEEDATTWMKGLREAAATGFLAASETSKSVILTFFLMMVVFPDVQKKVHAQIDAVIGRDRLPTLEDRPALPYVDAIIREVFRYSPILPLSLPHASVDDDVYRGYYIPKGAIILPNVWAMTRDEEKYPNADKFIPERFLNEDGSLKPSNTDNISYGFGRRICVGRYFADVSLWLTFSMALAAFRILRPTNEDGVEVDVVPRFTNGTVAHPVSFPYRLEPRMPVAKLEQLTCASAF